MSSFQGKSDIIRLRKQLEDQLAWGPVAQWHSSMFEELSEKIFATTQVSLSTATLKRFFEVVNHNVTPSVSTLDTLAQFSGNTNWREFKSSKTKRKKFKLHTNVPKKSLYVTLGFFIALVTFALISNRRADDVRDLAITFSSRPVTTSYPNSVVFDFNLQNIRSDSLHIQQYWDPTKNILIKAEQRQATGIYYFPGYFKAQLMVDGKSIRGHDLFLRSNGWLGTLDYEPVPKYFEPLRGAENSLGFPEGLLEEISTLEKPLKSTYHYINDLGSSSADNFQLKTSLRTVYVDKWAVCQSVELFIIGTSGAMIIPFSKIGCSSNNFLMLNDFYLSGKEHDLSFFGTDLSSFKNIELKVSDQQVNISIDATKVYQGKYKQTMGRLVGLRFKFLGLGEVQSLIVLDQMGREIGLQ